MSTLKLDRRVRRTRSMLLQGLIRLMGEKDIKDISVKELSDLVDINRGTFYLHYNDIYDMLNKIEDELFVEFNEILDRSFGEGAPMASPVPSLLNIFRFLDKNRDLVRVMIGPHGDLAFVNRLKELVKERLRNLLEDRAGRGQGFEYYSPFIVSGCIGVIETWINSPEPEPPEVMSRLLGNMIGQGLAVQPDK